MIDAKGVGEVHASDDDQSIDQLVQRLVDVEDLLSFEPLDEQIFLFRPPMSHLFGQTRQRRTPVFTEDPIQRRAMEGQGFTQIPLLFRHRLNDFLKDQTGSRWKEGRRYRRGRDRADRGEWAGVVETNVEGGRRLWGDEWEFGEELR